jgi:uncharacterized membrane protein YjgN (DUF898 family)
MGDGMTAAGWYQGGDGLERYWDGGAWTEQSRPVASGVPGGGVAARGGRQFAFDGGAATYFGTGLLAFLITVLTLGICFPFALVLLERWRCKHAFIDGQQLVFTGSGWGLFGLWLKWLLLIVVTLGIYLLWVGPRIARWKWENTGFAGHAVVRPA